MITYEKPQNILLLGGGRTMWEFHDWLTAKGYSVLAISAPRQATPQAHHSVRVMDSLDTLFLPTGPSSSMAICFGPAWPIPARLRESFGNRLLDFMSIPYPSFLGGAHETWAELLEQHEWGCCLQLVTANTKQGEVHDGDVIMGEKFPYEERYGKYLKFLKDFIGYVEDGQGFAEGFPSDGASFYPRLNTAQQGWIDWSWSAAEIMRFINAFGPYRGASTYLGNIVVHFCDVITGLNHWAHKHPFCAGLVVHVDQAKGVVHIACRDGELIVPANNTPLSPGDRLHTPREKLEEALLYRPEYDAKGDATGKKESYAEQCEQERKAICQKIKDETLGTSAANYVATDPLRIQLLKPNDVTQVYVDWLNDPKVNRYLEVRHQKWTRKSCEEFVQECCNHDNIALFGIYLHDRHIGNLKIGPANRHHHYADLSYFIGEKAEWGKGYATKAVKLAINWAWKYMNLHRLQAGVYDSNAASAEVLRKCGFEYECFFGKQLLDNGAWQDHKCYVLTNPDWKP